MEIIKANNQLREQVANWRGRGETLAFVPTMGNLHQGHLKLVEVARRHANHVAVSIFVNPMQFNQSADFKNYPRTLEQDIEKLHSLNVDLVYCPDENSIYPEGINNSTKINVPGLTEMLCGKFRPGHFEGVATVVAKLFNLVQPQVAVFGEKDFQQLLVIKKLVQDLNFPVEIIGVETEREESGLALSSRNRYLSDAEKQLATHLYHVMTNVAQQVRARCLEDSSGKNNFHDIEKSAMQQLEEHGFKPDYLEVRKADDLQIAHTADSNLRVFVAAWLGQARLIDNLPISLND